MESSLGIIEGSFCLVILAVAAFLPVTTMTQCSVLLHPQEEAAKIRMSARHKQVSRPWNYSFV